MMLFISFVDFEIFDFVYPDVPKSDNSYSSVVGSPDVDGSPSIGYFIKGNHELFFSDAIFSLNAGKLFFNSSYSLILFLNQHELTVLIYRTHH